MLNYSEILFCKIILIDDEPFGSFRTCVPKQKSRPVNHTK